MPIKHIIVDARSRPSSTGRYIDRLLEHLQTLDTENKYTVLVRPGDDWQPTAENFQATVCPYKQFSFNLFDQFTFAKYLRGLKPDLVHFGMTPQEPVFYSDKRVTTTHDLTMLRFTRAGRMSGWLHQLRMAGYRWLFKSSHKKSSQIIVPTEFVKQDLSKYQPAVADKITVTYESSEPPLPVAAEKPGLVEEPFIFHVGSPFPHKNIDNLVKAFEILHKQQPELRLVLAGKREYYTEKLEAWAANSPARSQIVFAGFVSDAELKWLYEHARAYVLPSLSEGFGLPGLEAMVHGCPLISSNATCLPEIYGEAAYYFNPEDIADMAAKIKEVIGDEKLREYLIQKGQAQVKKYSWRRMAEQTLEVYKRVLSD